MNRIGVTLAIAALALTLGVAKAADQPKAATAFDRLKTLVGSWEGKQENGTTFSMSMRLVSNNTAIEETINGPHDNQMVTLFTADGDRIALTHYCSMGNQPRMETSAVNAETSLFAFDFMGATNLAHPTDLHMNQLTLRIIDPDHISETWVAVVGGKSTPYTFQYTRMN
ncbi:MAG TPA: hypothetical protein VMU43_08645 [Candidatus Acidoferrum sp.]|nr:hypothetical protein [Candidatus Acidoferrum sp.]